jgi:hypothetical protein
MGFRHAKDKNGDCEKQGNDAVWEYVYTQKKLGRKVYKMSDYDDRVKKMDVEVVSPDGTSFTTDVKSMRKARSGKLAPKQDIEAIIELINVAGGPGWIDGKADFISFQMRETILEFPRRELAEIVREWIDVTNRVENFGDCAYKVYGRYGNKDLITKVPFDRLREEFKKRGIPYREFPICR